MTEKLARHVVETGYGSLPPKVVTVARQVVLDGVSVAMAGAAEPICRIAGGHVRQMGGNALSSVIGAGFRASPSQAAYLNGIATHVLDYEAMWHPATHPTSPTLPVAIALGEWLGLPGREIVTALALGFEVQGRLRLATASVKPDDLKLHPPGTIGVMGAAATAAKVLGLDVKETCYAFGIAASRAAGLMANVGTMAKSDHCGNAARQGIEAALLAKGGATAHPGIIEANLGYGEALFEDNFDLTALESGFGEPYRMVDPGLAFKFFPCQYGTHFGITAALELRAGEQLHPDDIEQVEIVTPLMRYVDRPFPSRGLEGKFSFQYTVAAALLDGAVNIETFSDDRRFSPDLEAMLRKVRLTQRADIPGVFEAMWVTVEVLLRDGRRLANTCQRPWGASDGVQPPGGLAGKARYCLQRTLPEATATRAVALCERFEELTTTEVRALMDLLREPPGGGVEREA